LFLANYMQLCFVELLFDKTQATLATLLPLDSTLHTDTVFSQFVYV